MIHTDDSSQVAFRALSGKVDPVFRQEMRQTKEFYRMFRFHQIGTCYRYAKAPITRLRKVSSLKNSELKVHQDLLTAMARVYVPNRLDWSEPEMERESAEYGACRFRLNGLALRFRVAKITPAKIGQFVTLWKRIGKGPIQPFDASDPIDFVVISCRSGQRLGQFVFPKSVLCERDIVADNGKGGKRALRVYPPWDSPTSRQALRTQNWQIDYFLEMSDDQPLNQAKARRLYGSIGSLLGQEKRIESPASFSA